MAQRSGNDSLLTGANRVVVKIGSSLLVDADTGELDRSWLRSLADDVARMRARGQQVVIVSSGAIALGRAYLGMAENARRLADFQAAAAAGQILLAHAYRECLEDVGIRAAQVLLTLGDTESRRRYLNARGTIENLLALGVVPVINENDTVATEEIRYGDNDRLAARVAEMTSSDCLVLLSDVDGLYDADPRANPDAELVPEIREMTPDLLAMAGATRTAHGSGGMVTKLEAARICMSAGCATVIAAGTAESPVERIEEGAPATWVLASQSPIAARKQWIAGSLSPRGTLEIDAGAAGALMAGGSLLPVGITAVTGDFERGDAVSIHGPGGVIGKGLTAYDSMEARAVCGARSEEIEGRLGYRGPDEMIHRDNLVMMDRPSSGAKEAVS